MFEPGPVFLLFIALKAYTYLPLVMALAVLRVAAGRGAWVRGLAAMAAAVALTGVAARFGPPLTRHYTGPVAQIADRIVGLGGGMALPLVASALLGLSAVPRGARWRLVDALNGVLVLVLLGLWAVTR